MTISISPVLKELQAKLKLALQSEQNAGKLESLAAALLGRLLQVPVFVAKSGFQHGADAGPAGRQQRRFRIEAKKYADSTTLNNRELLGEMDHALARDESLEAWILVATKVVSEQLANDLMMKGQQLGVPVVILGWSEDGEAPLAALCAWAPDLVDAIYSAEAGELARRLVGLEAAVEEIRRDLQPWSLGFEGIRRTSLEKLEAVWASPRSSNERLGQNAAGGAIARKVKRVRVHNALDSWWTGPAVSDAPAAVVGWDGVGKTWATLEWLVDRKDTQPIVLLVPSSAAACMAAVSETSLKAFLADRLCELAGVRDREHWMRRLDLLLKRPIDEGPALTVFFDGLNQEPTVQWLWMLKVLQGECFQGRVRVVLTTRQLHFEEKLSKLRGLVVQTVQVRVDPYDTDPGGELDQMLRLDGLSRSDLHPDLVELARTPRLFGLVVRFRERLVDAGQVTVHRLLWEYGRDTAGVRAGRSFSEAEWQEWLKRIAGEYRQGVRTWSVRDLGETAARPDLSEREVFARLSDIIDGRFTSLDPSGGYCFTPTVIAHALGTALLAALESGGSEDAEAELATWLDPIAGLDERAEILRAAVSILVEQGRAGTAVFAGPLVTAWLQAQNVPDQHRREIGGFASEIPKPLLYAIEHSTGNAQASARMWAIHALRAIPRTDTAILALLVSEIRRWFSMVSRDVDPRDDAERERRRSQRFLSRIGVDRAGPVIVLGVPLELVDTADWTLAASAPPILEGFPLERAIPVFEAAAIQFAVRGQSPAWDALKWLCLLNDKDPEETTRALWALSAEVRGRRPEPGIHLDLPARVGALLLWLTGREADEDAAVGFDPGLDHRISYETDYLPNPATSWFPLERRHAAGVLLTAGLGLRHRILRTKELLLDPTFEIPPQFAEQVRASSASIDVAKLDQGAFHTIEDHNFEELEPVLARCAPECLADLVRRELRSNASCPDKARYWRAIRASRHILLAGPQEAECAGALRLRGPELDAWNETVTANELLALELQGRPPADKFATVLEAGLADIFTDLGHVVGSLAQQEIDELIARFGGGSDKQCHDLLCLLSFQNRSLSDRAWGWVEERARSEQGVPRGLTFKLLAASDASRFARTLLSWNWSWSHAEHDLTNHYGTGALIQGTSGVPFEQIAPRLAPWRLLEAVRQRGGDANEVRLAATIFGRVLAAQGIDVPDLGVLISVNAIHRRSHPFAYLIELPPSQDKDPFRALKESQDFEAHHKAYRRAADTAMARIDDVRTRGANLYLVDVNADDLDLVVRFAPDLVDAWLEGVGELTGDFKRRVALAEGAYLGLCEALLRLQPTRGAMLWRALRRALVMRHIGAAGVDELLHLIFRAPVSEPVERLRDEVIDLPWCNTDQALENVAIAATCNGAAEWLEQIIHSDRRANLAWRRRRGAVLEGFRAFNSLPVAGAWPEGEIRTNHGAVARNVALNRAREASARVWWRQYLGASDPVSAYAAWVLFLCTADRQAWSWMHQDVRAAMVDTEFFRRKMAHVELNLSALRQAMEKREEKRDSQFLMRDTVDSIGPWRRESA